MRAARLLLGKDLRVLARSRGLLAALVVYPLVIAVIVALVVRYAGDRPRIALVDEDGLPSEIVVGEVAFDVQRVFDRAAEDVELVRLDRDEAQRQLANGDVLGIVVIPAGFERRIRGMTESPTVVLEVTEGGLSNRIVEKVQALVFAVNRELQDAYIEANLEYVDLLLDGGPGSFLGNEFDVIGLEEAARRLEPLTRHPDPEVAVEAQELLRFVEQATLAIENVDTALEATARPVELERSEIEGRALLLGSTVQAYGIALTLGFVALLLAAAGIAAERDENVIGRLIRRPVGRSALVGEKMAFVAIVGGAIGLVLAIVFGLVVEIGDLPGGEPWGRLPLIVLGLLLGGAAFGAVGVLVGVLAREARAATLLAFLVALPMMLLGLVPRSVVEAAGWISDAFPFAHTARLLSAALGDTDPAVDVLREAGWLIGLGLAYAAAARLSVRRLLT
jgi:ABC-type Na+ efflux pump permease subunit